MANARSIEARLAALDALIATKAASVASTLAPPAKPAALAKLRARFGKDLPAELRAWFAWHDGQRSTASAALIPDTSWSAMSCAEAARTHAFLAAEGLRPWKPTWMPLFHNGGGDHLCLDRDTGAIVRYSHDDASRPKAYASFAALLVALERGYAKLTPAKRFAAPAIATWSPVARAPTEAQLARAPVGTAYAFAADLPMCHRHFIFVKLGDDRWLECCGRDLAGALAMWKQHAAKPPTTSSGSYKRTWDVWYDAKQYRTTLTLGRAAQNPRNGSARRSQLSAR